jgi:hypothetical protein
MKADIHLVLIWKAPSSQAESVGSFSKLNWLESRNLLRNYRADFARYIVEFFGKRDHRCKLEA